MAPPLHGGTLRDREDLSMAPESTSDHAGQPAVFSVVGIRDEDKRPLVLPMGQCLNHPTVTEWAALDRRRRSSQTFPRKRRQAAQLDCAPSGTLQACLIVGRLGTHRATPRPDTVS